MKGKKETAKDEPLTAEEEEARLGFEARKRSIGQALRHAAGLPYEDDPFVEDSDEADLRDINEFVGFIWRSRPDMGQNPRAVEVELGAVRGDINRLRKRLASLDRETIRFMKFSETPEGEAMLLANQRGDFHDIKSAFDAWRALPDEQHAFNAVWFALDRLEAVIVPLIENAIKASARLPTTGRIPNYHARNVAYYVALYVANVTGLPPGLWTGSEPSGPYARALKEIFEATDVEADIQRPGEWAISKLTAELSENSEF